MRYMWEQSPIPSVAPDGYAAGERCSREATRNAFLSNPMTALWKLHWPPFDLGIGTPANLALLSPSRGRPLLRTALIAVLAGVLTVFVMGALDRFFFGGASIKRVKLLGSLPITERLAIVAFSAVTEELIYRLVIATAVAAVLFLLLRRSMPHAAIMSMWAGILAAALLFGLAHV